MKPFKEILYEKVIKEHDPYTSKTDTRIRPGAEYDEYDEDEHGEYDPDKPDHELSTENASKHNLKVFYLKNKDGKTQHTAVEHIFPQYQHKMYFDKKYTNQYVESHIHKGKIDPKHIVSGYSRYEKNTQKEQDRKDYNDSLERRY